MRYTIWALMLTVGILTIACGAQEQPAAKQSPPAATAPAPSPAASKETAPTPGLSPAQPQEPLKIIVDAPLKPTPAPARTPQPSPVSVTATPESVTFESSQGKVFFSHANHTETSPCASCHGVGTPGKISLGKEAAHNLCRSCHKAKGAGPTACTGCHKK